MGQELIEDRIELVQPRQVNFHHEAVLARDPVALHDLRQLLGERGPLRQLTWRGANSHECTNRISKGG